MVKNLSNGCCNFLVNLKLYKLIFEIKGMFFNKKDEKGRLPDLPPLPVNDFLLKKPEKVDARDLRDVLKQDIQRDSLDEDSEKHALPSFPDSPNEKGFSQSVIKDAVGESQLSELPELPELPVEKESVTGTGIDESVVGVQKIEPKKNFKTIESDSEMYSSSRIMVPKKIEVKEKNQDIFVKLDKFRAGKKSLNEVKMRLDEIDLLFKKIREIKMREEQELAGWENEVNFIKDRLKDVTENIFEKV